MNSCFGASVRFNSFKLSYYITPANTKHLQRPDHLNKYILNNQNFYILSEKSTV